MERNGRGKGGKIWKRLSYCVSLHPELGVDSFEVRQLKDWDQPKDGLIIPGGESTTQAKLLNELGLMEPVKEAIATGLPVYGTCAGLILLAKKIEGEPSQRIASMDIKAWGEYK